MGRRMISSEVLNSDEFVFDLSDKAKIFYLVCIPEADCDGFIANPGRVARSQELKTDIIEELIKKEWLLSFDDVKCVVVRDWWNHNWLNPSKYRETGFLTQKKTLYLLDSKQYSKTCNGKKLYVPDNPEDSRFKNLNWTVPAIIPNGTLEEPKWNPNGTLEEPQYNINKVNITESNLNESNLNESKEKEFNSPCDVIRYYSEEDVSNEDRKALSKYIEEYGEDRTTRVLTNAGEVGALKEGMVKAETYLKSAFKKEVMKNDR